jgi:hypothetical protein
MYITLVLTIIHIGDHIIIGILTTIVVGIIVHQHGVGQTIIMVIMEIHIISTDIMETHITTIIMDIHTMDIGMLVMHMVEEEGMLPTVIMEEMQIEEV